MRRARLTVLLLLLCAGASAQNKFDIGANFMTRGELRNGGFAFVDEELEIPDDNFAGFILERTRLTLDYAGENLTANITGQHCGTWGSREGGNFMIYEAWVKFDSKNGFFTKIGRQNLSYDDQRIFGADDWSMTGMTHDVLKAGYEGHGHKVHVFGAYNQNLENIDGGTYFSGGLQPYKAMEALWYHFDFPSFPLGASLLLMNVDLQGGDRRVDETTFHEQIYGTFLSFQPKNWALEAAYYREAGKEEHGLPINAWMASGKVTWKPSQSFQLYGGYDFLSGDKYFAVPPEGRFGMVHHDVIRGFSSLYGSNHKFYGAMDFFYVTTYVRGFTPGLQNAYIGTGWKPGKNLSLDLSYHFLAIATNLDNVKKPLGHEVEFSASYSFRPDTKLSMGFSFMKGTDTMAYLKRSFGDNRLEWAWAMLTVSPKFLSGK